MLRLAMLLAGICVFVFATEALAQNSGSNQHSAAGEASGRITSFSIFKDEAKCKLPTGLEGNLCLRLNGAARIDETTLRIRVDGTVIDIKPRVIANSRLVIFPLVYASGKNQAALKDSRDLWSRLLGSPFSENWIIDVPFDVEMNGISLPLASENGASAQATFPLLRYEGTWMLFGLLIAVGAVAVVIHLAVKSTALRDRPAIPQISIKDSPYSLGKFQMAVWFCLIFVSFIFIWVVTSEISSITSETFVLLGISAGTALGAAAVDRAKESPAAKVDAELSGMGIRTVGDVGVLQKAAMGGRGGDVANLHLPSATPAASGVTPTVIQLLESYDGLIDGYRSSGFIKDLVSDSTGATIHRFQMLAWTVLLGTLYVMRVYWDLQIPEFGTNLLTLMGISGGIYVGFKIPER